MQITSTRAMMSVVKMSLMPASMLVVVSTTVDVVMPSGRRSPSRAISALTLSPTATALLPGS